MKTTTTSFFIIFYMLFFISCNIKNNFYTKPSNIEIQNKMADSIISNVFLGFELGSEKFLVKRSIDSLSKNNNIIQNINWSIIDKTSSTTDHFISIKGQDILKFNYNMYFKTDSTNIVEIPMEYCLFFYNKKLYAIEIASPTMFNKDDIERCPILDNYIDKYGDWYLKSNDTTQLQLKRGYHMINVFDNYAYTAYVGSMYSSIRTWNFKNIVINYIRDSISLECYSKAPLPKLYNNIMNLVNNASSVRDETILGIKLSCYSKNPYNSTNFLMGIVEDFLEDLTIDDYFWRSNESGDVLLRNNIRSSFEYSNKPYESSTSYISRVNYSHKELYSIIKDSINNIEQTIKINKENLIRKNHLRDSIQQDSVDKALKRKLNQQDI